LDCRSEHAIGTPEEEWLHAVALDLLADLEEFEHPTDRVRDDHEHRWELSEVNDHFTVWECLECRAVKAVADVP
jgi:hypothetical protein